MGKKLRENQPGANQDRKRVDRLSNRQDQERLRKRASISRAPLGGQQINTDADHEIGRTEESQDSGKAIAGIRALSKHVCCLHRFHRRNATTFIVNMVSVNTRIIVHIIAGVKWEIAYIKRHTMASIS